MTARSLSDVPRGETVRLGVVESDERTARRLAELGLTPGVEVTVLQATRGPVLIAVRGARVAVGRAMASAMRVLSREGDPE
jgi:Fe2+ transport system protein FeoA